MKLYLNETFKRLLLLFGITFLTIGLISCSNNNTVAPVNGPNNVSASMMADQNASDNLNDVLTVQSAKFLIEFLKIEVQSGSGDQDIKIGPFVVEINLTGTVTQIAVTNVPQGTYHEVLIKIHKHTPNEPVIDPDFGNSGNVGFSGVITGTFNGTPFVYKSVITAVQEVEINPPISVLPNINGMTNVTLVVNPKLWFVLNGVVLNPLDPNNQQIIDNNIKASFIKAFKDDDRNGQPDGG